MRLQHAAFQNTTKKQTNCCVATGSASGPGRQDSLTRLCSWWPCQPACSAFWWAQVGWGAASRPEGGPASSWPSLPSPGRAAALCPRLDRSCVSSGWCLLPSPPGSRSLPSQAREEGGGVGGESGVGIAGELGWTRFVKFENGLPRTCTKPLRRTLSPLMWTAASITELFQWKRVSFNQLEWVCMDWSDLQLLLPLHI